jgi:hypothetical protein
MMEKREEDSVLQQLRATRGYFTTEWMYQTQYRIKAFERLEGRGVLEVHVVGDRMRRARIIE